jgi:integrase
MRPFKENRRRVDGSLVELSRYRGWVRKGSSRFKVTLFTDKKVSERELRRLQAVADDEIQSGASGRIRKQFARPVSEHVDDYLSALKMTGVSADHYRISKWMMAKLIELAGWSRMPDVSVDSLRAVVAKLNGAGYATNYVNKFISRAKAFVRWMYDNQRIGPDGLLTSVRRGNVAKGKKTRARRALHMDEARALLAASPEPRRQRYLFAMLSGLRRGELKDLRHGDLRLKAPIPFIQLREDQTKNQKADAIPLHPALVVLLDKIGLSADNSFVFRTVPDMKTMARDLLNAGVASLVDDSKMGIKISKDKYVNISDARGRRTDFHSLRHTFKTFLDATGCTEATSDALTRHGDKTVGDGYRHAELADMVDALRKIPDPSPLEVIAIAATGTDGGSPVVQSQCLHMHNGAQVCTSDVLVVDAVSFDLSSGKLGENIAMHGCASLTLRVNGSGDIVKIPGRVPKWTKGTDCKSVIRRFESDLGL